MAIASSDVAPIDVQKLLVDDYMAEFIVNHDV